MVKGRLPKAEEIDNKKFKKSKQELEKRKSQTPVFESKNFIPPPTLTEKEREIWDWMVSVFRDMYGCQVSDADVHLMENYCRAKAAVDEADAELKKDSRPYVIIVLGKDAHNNPRTTAKVNPNITKRKDNMLLCLKYFDQLGLSPVARSRVGIARAKNMEEEDMLKEIFSRSDD